MESFLVGEGTLVKLFLLSKTVNSPHWKKVDFQIFDSPSLTFEDRIEHLKQLVSNTSASHLKNTGAAKGQEQSSRDEFAAPKSNPKLFTTPEAIEIGYEAGKGRNASVTGSLKCKMQSARSSRLVLD
ncbi:hypothetical protein HDU78_007500 [Chytriomyces hyalinus]|nr:hypothetical protein HDU78_007500 [Chytriomyces hyalinus]